MMDPQNAAGSADAVAREEVISVGGIMCAHCDHRMETTLAALPGIASAKADLGRQQVRVVYNPALASLDDMKRAIENAGYQYHGPVGTK